MRKSMLTLAVAALALCAPVGLAPAAAQDMPGPQRMENVTWARVVMTKFKPGKRQRAMEIIQNYFAKADGMTGKKSGIHGIHLDTGEWDIIYVFPMAGGPADLTWATAPDDIAWMEQMAKLAGGQDQALAIIAEFDSLIANQTSFIGHAHTDY